MSRYTAQLFLAPDGLVREIHCREDYPSPVGMKPTEWMTAESRAGRVWVIDAIAAPDGVAAVLAVSRDPAPGEPEPLMFAEAAPLPRLGCIPSAAPPQCLRFSAYLDAAGAVALPKSTGWAAAAAAATKNVYGNDSWGDCVIAGKMHLVGNWTANAVGTPALGTSAEAVDTYHRVCGRGDPGCNIPAVLDVMKSAGISVGGVLHKIDGYVSVDWTNADEVRAAIYLFGGVTIGISLPRAWHGNLNLWDVPSGFGAMVVGGHDVSLLDYDETGPKVSTWGALVPMTWAALASRYVTEMYAPLSPDWYAAGGLAPNLIDAATLKADLAKIGGGSVPVTDATLVPQNQFRAV